AAPHLHINHFYTVCRGHADGNLANCIEVCRHQPSLSPGISMPATLRSLEPSTRNIDKQLDPSCRVALPQALEELPYLTLSSGFAKPKPNSFSNPATHAGLRCF